MSTTYKEITTKELKTALKAQFSWKFSVTQKAGSRFIHVNWTDGPTREAVGQFLQQYNDDGRDDIQTDLWMGSQYTVESRTISNKDAWPIHALLDLRLPLPPLHVVIHEVYRKRSGWYELSTYVVHDEHNLTVTCDTDTAVAYWEKVFTAAGYITNRDGLSLHVSEHNA